MDSLNISFTFGSGFGILLVISPTHCIIGLAYGDAISNALLAPFCAHPRSAIVPAVLPIPCISFDTLEVGSNPSADCHIPIPVPIHSDRGLSTFPAVSVEKSVFIAGATRALAHIAVGITLVAVCADPSPVSRAHFANRVTQAVQVSWRGADQILEIP